MPQAFDKNKTEKDPLEGLRSQIDVIDREIAGLLLKRGELVGRVGKLKKDQKITQSYIRPRREATMLRDLIRHFEGTNFPRAAVASIWRTIIGASTTMESPLSLSVFCYLEDMSPLYLAREYFGNFIPCTVHRTAEEVLNDISRNQHIVGVFPRAPGKDKTACWWETLASYSGINKPVVFAVLPFVRSRRDITPPPTALAVGRVDLQPTGDDETLFVLTAEKPVRADDWATWYGQSLSALSLGQAGLKTDDGRSALFGVQGFHYGDTAKLAALLKEVNKASGGVKIEGVCIGAYASAYRHK